MAKKDGARTTAPCPRAFVDDENPNSSSLPAQFVRTPYATLRHTVHITKYFTYLPTMSARKKK